MLRPVTSTEIAAGLLLGIVIALHAAPTEFAVGRFSAEAPGDHRATDWDELTFTGVPRRTRYSLVQSDIGGITATVVKAQSDRSASGLVRPVAVDLAVYPVLRWRWRVDQLNPREDVTTKSGDDFPARLYVTFAKREGEFTPWESMKSAVHRLVYGRDLPSRAINYVWASRVPLGTVVPSPYTDRVRIIVVESGPENLNRWTTEHRNVLDDYRRAFGEQPAQVTGVGIMTDSDDTGTRAVAYYGDIVFEANP